jgi:filamentous hemagglutinin
MLAIIASNVSAAQDKQLNLEGKEVLITGALNSNETTFDSSKKSTNLHAGIVKPSQGMLSRGTTKGTNSSTSLAATTLSGGNISIKATGTPGKDKDGNDLLSGIALAGVKLNTPGELALDAGQGNLAFNIIETTSSTSLETTQRDIAYQKAKGAGSTQGTAEYNDLNYGKLSIKAGSVTVQTGSSAADAAAAPATAGGAGQAAQAAAQAAAGGNPATPASLKTLAAKPGMAWINDVAAQSAELAKTNPAAALHIQNVQLAHDQWDYKQQGLTKEGAAIVTLVVAYFTAGAGTGAVTAVTGASASTIAGSVALSAAAGAASAAITTLATQAAVSMINNQGNLGAVLNELGSKDSIKNLAMAMVTAGALSGLSTAMGGITTANGTNWANINATSPFVDQLQKNLVNQLTSNVLQTALTGGNSKDYEKSLQTSLLTAFISTGAAQGANAIGDMQANGTLNALTHKLAHAIAGCAAGAATASVGGSSASNGCGSGAIGAVIGELTAEAAGSSMKPEDRINLARLMAGVAGALTGGDVTLAANAGGNAVVNNYLNHTQATMRAALEDKKRRQALTPTEQQQLDGLNVLDIAKDLALKDACKTAGDACDAARRDLNASIASYSTSSANGTNPRLSATGNASVTGERDQNLQLANDPKLASQSLMDSFLEFAPGQVAGYAIGGALGLYLQEARAIYAAIKADTALVNSTAGTIRNVNPGYPTTGRTENCVNCTAATDATLSGNPAAALPSNGPVSIRALETQYGSQFGSSTTRTNIQQQLLNAGDGARGIVFGSRGPNEAGHVFNVVNQNGVIRFLDGQTGAPATFNGYQSFHLLRTN